MNRSTFGKYMEFARPLTGAAHDYYYNGYIAGLNLFYAREKKHTTLEQHEAALQKAKNFYQSPEASDGISDGLEGKRPLGMPTGHTGNSNASKDEKFDTSILVSCTSKNKAVWDAYARKNGYKSLPALVRDLLKDCE